MVRCFLACLAIAGTTGALHAQESLQVLWKTRIGSMSSTPTVVGNAILVGSRYRVESAAGKVSDGGALLCFERKTGELLWEQRHARLPDRIHDMPGEGITGSPVVDKGRLFYVTNRWELICCRFDPDAPKAAPVLWKRDLAADGFPRAAGDSFYSLPTPLVVGDLVIASTGNGTMFGYTSLGGPFVPKPKAPSIVACEIQTGKVAWSANVTGDDLMYGQWSSPALWHTGKEPRIVFPAGDGKMHMLDTACKLLWSVDLNYAEATRWTEKTLGTRSFAVNAPTIRGSRAYVAITQDMETYLQGTNAICAVDLDDKTPDAERVVWRFRKRQMHGIFGKLLVDESDRVFALAHDGELLCIDAKSGRELGSRKLGEFERFGTPTLIGGKLVVGVEEVLSTLTHEPKMTKLRDDVVDDDGGTLGEILGAPRFESGVLYVVTRRHLMAIRWPPRE
jgi:outer membrane protein assembly factor BamB